MEFKESLKQYRYGKEENDRILALSDEEFEKEAKYEKDIASLEPVDPDISGDRIQEIDDKYEYFRKLRESIKIDYPYGKEENDRILALSDEEFEKEVKYEENWIEPVEPGDLEDRTQEVKDKYEYFRKLRSTNNEKNNQKENDVEK